VLTPDADVEQDDIVWRRSLGVDRTRLNSPAINPTSGATTVAVAGTRVALSTGVRCQRIMIKANVGNAGDIYVGGSTVSAANGYILDAAATLELWIGNANLLYIDAATASDGVTWLAV